MKIWIRPDQSRSSRKMTFPWPRRSMIRPATRTVAPGWSLAGSFGGADARGRRRSPGGRRIVAPTGRSLAPRSCGASRGARLPGSHATRPPSFPLLLRDTRLRARYRQIVMIRPVGSIATGRLEPQPQFDTKLPDEDHTLPIPVAVGARIRACIPSPGGPRKLRNPLCRFRWISRRSLFLKRTIGLMPESG